MYIGLQKIKDVIDYIEDNITADLDCKTLSSKMGLSVYEFRRIFSFVIGCPISEYIRKRRLSLAALELIKDKPTDILTLAEKYGYDKLTFLTGDIADYEGVSKVDMVVTLHACDTATDYALAKAVKWGAKVILSVPCCQHEINKQIQNDLLSPVLQYGLLKERMSALLTDGIRGQLLEMSGYRTQILEFIDMEHTPKNIMIRAIRQGKKADGAALETMMKELHVKPTLYGLLVGEEA